MGHVRAPLGGAGDAGQPHHLGMAQHPLDGGGHRLPAHQTGGGVAYPLHDVRKPEHCLLAREPLR